MSNHILEEFYDAVFNDKPWPHIPRSEVFYVRTKLNADLGTDYSLDRVERAMFLEGMLDEKDVLDPHRKRDWEE